VALDSSRAEPEQSLDLAELRRAFLRLAGNLAPKQRAAFVLREIEGLETAEVAEIMEVAESTVRNHLLQARRILRAGLERDYPGLVPRGRSTGDSGEKS
jgi:RNA polymerase sigma-70 factor (ECF subfamily)